MQAARRLLLIGRVLRRQAEHLGDAELLQFGEMIAEAAGLRRAAARAGDVVPAGRQIDAGHAGARIEVEHGAAFELGQIDGAAGGRRQRQVGQTHAGEMVGAAIVLRRRDIGRQDLRIMRAGRFSHDVSPYDMNSINEPSGSRK